MLRSRLAPALSSASMAAIRAAITAAATATLALAGCEQNLGPGGQGLYFIRVTMVDPKPEQLGSPVSPVQLSEVTYDIETFGADGSPWTEDTDLDVFLSFSGNKVGRISACGTDDERIPLKRITLT